MNVPSFFFFLLQIALLKAHIETGRQGYAVNSCSMSFQNLPMSPLQEMVFGNHKVKER